VLRLAKNYDDRPGLNRFAHCTPAFLLQGVKNYTGLDLNLLYNLILETNTKFVCMNNLQEPRTRLHVSGTTPYLIGAKESNQIKRLQTLETFSVSTSFSTHFFSSWSDRILFLLVFLSRETRIFVCVHCFQPSHFFALSLSLSLPPCSPRIVTHNELCHTFSAAIWTSCLMMIHRGKTACLYCSQKIYINVHKHTQMYRILGSFDGTIPTWLALKRAHRSIGQRASDARWEGKFRPKRGGVNCKGRD